MLKSIASVLVATAAVGALLVAVPGAFSQMEQAQPLVYTYVGQFQVPRANWAQYSEDTDKTFVPVAQKMLAEGAIVSWTTFEHIIHTPDGYTHGSAWSSPTIAGLMKMLDEVRKNGPRPAQIAATKHEDLLMQSTMYRAGSGTPTYFRVICQMAKAEKPEGYTAALKKYLVPTFEEQLKKGVATYWGVDEQYVNTGAPSMRCVVIDYPDAEGMDKWAAAINATMAKWTPADREAFFGSMVPDSRRDIMGRVTHFGHK